MFEQLSQCEKIEELCLECTRPIDLFDSFGVTSISKLKDLKKLKLWNIINWTASDYVTLFVNGNLKNLVALDLKCFEYINGEVPNPRKTSGSGGHRDPFDMSPFATNAPVGGFPDVNSMKFQLLKEEWFHGPISRVDAENLLQNVSS